MFMNGKLADVYMSVGRTTMNRELIDIHRGGLPMEYLQRGLPMEYLQQLKYDREQQEFKNRCFNEFLYYSEREEHGGSRNKVLDCEPVCLKRTEGDKCDMPQNLQNLQNLQLKQHRIENSDEIRNSDLSKAHKNWDWKQSRLKGVCEDMKKDSCSDLRNQTSSKDYKFMNGGGFSKGRPDLTLSLSCARDRQEIGCRPEDTHKPSYSYTPHQVSDFYV